MTTGKELLIVKIIFKKFSEIWLSYIFMPDPKEWESPKFPLSSSSTEGKIINCYGKWWGPTFEIKHLGAVL